VVFFPLEAAKQEMGLVEIVENGLETASMRFNIEFSPNPSGRYCCPSGNDE
jgi:hypothetical protein